MSATSQLGAIPWFIRVPTVMSLCAVALSLAISPAQAESLRQQQWHLEALNITQVHQISKGKDVVVAVVDTGVDATHPDLVGRVLPGVQPNNSSANGQLDEDGHGTSMAGTIAGTNSGGKGILGIAPEAKILPVKVSEGKAIAKPAEVAAGIRDAVDRGAKVINISWSGSAPANARADINYALSKDVVVVAGSGNVSAGQQGVGWPANVPGVIAVTGTDRSGNIWSGSTQGIEAVVSAPATDIISASPRSVYASQYNTGDGTSSSSAIVAGIVALVRAKYPNMSAINVINRIIKTADDAGPIGRDAQYGFGRVNALKALTQDVPEVNANPLVIASGSVQPSSTDTPKMIYASETPGNNASGGRASRVLPYVGIGLVVLLLAVFAIRIRSGRNQ
jgi:membrane-anchored mycosin MYCP